MSSIKIEDVKLTKDLIDLKNQYLDPISYLKLISSKPEEFNPKLITSIIENYEKQFPLAMYLEVYALAKKYADKWTDMNTNIKCGKTKLDPLYISTIILRKICLNGENIGSVDDTHPSEGTYLEVEEWVSKQQDSLMEHIDEVDSEIAKYISDDEILLKIEKMNQLFDPDTEDSIEAYNTLSLFYKAWEILKIQDVNVYDTSDWSTYEDKIISIFVDLVREVKI